MTSHIWHQIMEHNKTCRWKSRSWLRRAWRYQKDNQNPYIEEKQTTKWPNDKVQKDKQRSTKHKYKIKDRVTRTSLKTRGELRCSERESSFRRVSLVANPVIRHEWGKDWEVFATSGTYSWSFVTQIFNKVQPSHGCDRNIFEIMSGTLGSAASLLAATLFQGNFDRNHKLWNIVSTERYIRHMQVLLECCYI